MAPYRRGRYRDCRDRRHYGPDFLDRFKSKRQPTTSTPTASDKGKAGNAPTRLPRHKGLWASVPLEVLTDRRHWGTHPGSLPAVALHSDQVLARPETEGADQCHGGGNRVGPEAEAGVPGFPGSRRLRHGSAGREKDPHSCQLLVAGRGAAVGNSAYSAVGSSTHTKRAPVGNFEYRSPS